MESDRQSEPRCASMSLIRYTLFSARIAIECGPRRSTLPLQAGMASLQRVASSPPPRILALPTNFSQREIHMHIGSRSQMLPPSLRGASRDLRFADTTGRWERMYIVQVRSGLRSPRGAPYNVSARATSSPAASGCSASSTRTAVSRDTGKTTMIGMKAGLKLNRTDRRVVPTTAKQAKIGFVD